MDLKVPKELTYDELKLIAHMRDIKVEKTTEKD